MTSNDVEAVVDIVLRTPLWQRHGVERAQFAARLQRGLEAEAPLFVATVSTRSQERIAGFIWYAVNGAFGRSGYVMLIGIDSAYHGQGIGRRLMAHAETALFEQSDEIFLLVSDFNLPAQRFYRELGYRQIGAIPDYVTPGIAELIFFKRRSGGENAP